MQQRNRLTPLHVISMGFEKVNVSSRAELVARLFAEHYADPFHDTLVRLD